MIVGVLRGERGQAITIALAFMVFAVPTITSALLLASTLSLDSGLKTRKLKSQFSAFGAQQFHLLGAAAPADSLEVPQVVAGRKVGVEGWRLDDCTYTAHGPALCAVGVQPEEPHGARRGPHQSQEHPQGRRLA